MTLASNDPAKQIGSFMQDRLNSLCIIYQDEKERKKERKKERNFYVSRRQEMIHLGEKFNPLPCTPHGCPHSVRPQGR